MFEEGEGILQSLLLKNVKVNSHQFIFAELIVKLVLNSFFVFFNFRKIGYRKIWNLLKKYEERRNKK